jgi:hypothetical protein
MQFHGTRIIRIIGQQAKPSSALKKTRDFDQKAVVDHSAIFVPPFWPGIRKEDVDAISTCVRQPGEHFAGLAMEDFDIVQCFQGDLFSGLEDALALALNAEEISAGEALRHLDKESPLVAADIDLERWAPLSLPAKWK